MPRVDMALKRAYERRKMAEMRKGREFIDALREMLCLRPLYGDGRDARDAKRLRWLAKAERACRL